MTSTPPPQPYGAVPSPRQLAWHRLEYYGFLHFTVNTFTGREWGLGDESPALFDPAAFDADQIAETAQMGGMQGLILTAKHHDGFCLWPSAYTAHSVAASPWRGGKGDVVGEIAAACAKRGLKFGVYLSPWDRHHPDYGHPAYIQYYRAQLRELLTSYGPLFEVWFDGANGGDGYYGGRYEQRKIDASTYYRWGETFALVRELQPEACIFGMPGADLRWVGNEQGIAGDPCWHTLAEYVEGEGGDLNGGRRGGPHWQPAECDVSIRPGWFYHPEEDGRLRSPENLLDLYFQSVGRAASLLLNLPPTPAGQIHAADRLALLEFRRLRDAIFSQNLARGVALQPSDVRGGSPRFGAQNLLDGSLDTYWSTDDGVCTPEVVLRFAQPVRFNVLGLREAVSLGQRVEGFALDIEESGGWKTVHSGAAIGWRQLARLSDCHTSAVRLRITASPACPAITELSLHRM